MSGVSKINQVISSCVKTLKITFIEFNYGTMYSKHINDKMQN